MQCKEWGVCGVAFFAVGNNDEGENNRRGDKGQYRTGYVTTTKCCEISREVLQLILYALWRPGPQAMTGVDE